MSMRGMLARLFADLSWQPPQKSRTTGLEGRCARGLVKCSGAALWHTVHSNVRWGDTALVRAICEWQAAHDPGVSGGVGSCGLWQLMQASMLLWSAAMICGKPVGREGRYS